MEKYFLRSNATISRADAREQFCGNSVLYVFPFSPQEMEKYFLRSKAAISRADAHEPFRGISVCIMDEASQCVEPEALIPLKFGFNKVIMVRYLNMYQPTAG